MSNLDTCPAGADGRPAHRRREARRDRPPTTRRPRRRRRTERQRRRRAARRRARTGGARRRLARRAWRLPALLWTSGPRRAWVAGYLRCVLRSPRAAGTGPRPWTRCCATLERRASCGELAAWAEAAADARGRRTIAQRRAGPGRTERGRGRPGIGTEPRRRPTAAPSSACPTARCGASTSSSGRPTASARSRCAWWRASCAAGGSCGCGATSSCPAGRRSGSTRQALFVAYYASAELGCFLALGWPMPARILDLFAEFRAATNGRRTPCGAGLLGAMVWHGLDGMAADEKDAMRALAMRGGPYSADERRGAARLLRGRRGRAGAAPAGDAARDPLPPAGRRPGARPSPAAGPLHGRRGPHGVERRPDRHAHARAAAGRLGRDQGGADRRGRRRVRRLRRPRVQGGPVRGLPRARGHPLAAAAERGAGAGRRHLPRPGQVVARAAAPAASSATRWASCGSTPSRSGRTGATAACSRPSAAGPAATSRATRRFVFGPATWIRGLIRPEPGTALAYVDFAMSTDTRN